MIVVRLWGGIGNQLFQYAFGNYLSSHFNMPVFYDIGSFGRSDKLRKLELEQFIDELPVFNTPHCFFSRRRGFVSRFLRCIFKLSPKKHIIEEKNLDIFWRERIKTSSLYYFQGYWQQIDFANFLLRNNLLKIRREGIPDQLLSYLEEITNDLNSVSIHIRRGDYFSPNNIEIYGVCNEDYFHEAISVVLEKNENAHFYIFSDDLDWVSMNIKINTKFTLVNNYDVPQFWYIYMMSLCRHNIISNSTFSWWGAFLNDNKDKIVISPKKWTLDSESTIALESWMKI